MNGRVDDFIHYYKRMLYANDIDPFITISNYIVDRLELNKEQILWFCFLTSVTYHLPSAYLIINEYPDLEIAGIKRLQKWWEWAQYKIPFQTDKLKQRKFFVETVESYKNMLNGKSQSEYFDDLLNSSPEENFNKLWNTIYKPIKHFGRFSVWNWAQALKQVAVYNIEPTTLFLGEKNAESHTHGLCFAFGKDEWSKKERIIENGKRKKIVHNFTKDEKIWLEDVTKKEIFEKLQEENIPVDNFTIETVACAYKKTFRERDSRYVGYYIHRLAEDIENVSKHPEWNGVDWSLLWDGIRETTPKEYFRIGIDKSKFKLTYEEKIEKI